MNNLIFVNILETDGVIQEKVRQWRNKEEIRKCMLNQSVIGPEEHARWLDGLRRRGDSKFWVVFCKDVPVGAAYLQNVDREKATTEWGFYIGEEAYKARGLGQQILFNLLEEVFDRMEFEILLTKVLSSNVGAIHLYKKFYFNEKDRFFSRDQREVIILEFTKSAWARTKEELKAMCEERINKSAQ